MNTTLILLEPTEDGEWIATQDGVDLVGRGSNPGRAVAHYGELVAMTTYEDPETDEEISAEADSEDGQPIMTDGGVDLLELDLVDEFVIFRSPSSGRHRIGRVFRIGEDVHGVTVSISAGGDLYHVGEDDVVAEVGA